MLRKSPPSPVSPNKLKLSTSSGSSHPYVSITKSEPKFKLALTTLSFAKKLNTLAVNITNEKVNAKVIIVLEFLLTYLNIKILYTGAIFLVNT